MLFNLCRFRYVTIKIPIDINLIKHIFKKNCSKMLLKIKVIGYFMDVFYAYNEG